MPAPARNAGAASRLPAPAFMFVAGPASRSSGELARTVLAAVQGGVNIVQLRDREADEEALRSATVETREAAGDALVVLNTHADLAATLLLDGVHLPERFLAGEGAATCAARHARLLIGVSVHSLASARAAASQGADYLLAGHVFPTPSHAGVPGRGLDWLAEICGSVAIPVLAIGGVTPENAPACLAAGARGIAVMSPITSAADPADAARCYRAAIE
jgi:thiamine-phosphate diphosphorylase